MKALEIIFGNSELKILYFNLKLEYFGMNMEYVEQGIGDGILNGMDEWKIFI
jgi:hypothetical protein